MFIDMLETIHNTSLAVKGGLALPHNMQCSTAFTIQNVHLGASKWPTGFGRGQTLGYWACTQLLQNKFFDWSSRSMRNINNGEKKRKRREKGETSGPLTSLPDRLNSNQLQLRCWWHVKQFKVKFKISNFEKNTKN